MCYVESAMIIIFEVVYAMFFSRLSKSNMDV